MLDWDGSMVNMIPAEHQHANVVIVSVLAASHSSLVAVLQVATGGILAAGLPSEHSAKNLDMLLS